MPRFVIPNQRCDKDQGRDSPACPFPECGGVFLSFFVLDQFALNHCGRSEGFAEEKGAGVRISTWAFVLMLVWLSIMGLA
jgi:hypothetical protein